MDSGVGNFCIDGAVPFKRSGAVIYEYRTLGLGYANLGSMLDGERYSL